MREGGCRIRFCVFVFAFAKKLCVSSRGESITLNTFLSFSFLSFLFPFVTNPQDLGLSHCSTSLVTGFFFAYNSLLFSVWPIRYLVSFLCSSFQTQNKSDFELQASVFAFCVCSVSRLCRLAVEAVELGGRWSF